MARRIYGLPEERMSVSADLPLFDSQSQTRAPGPLGRTEWARKLILRSGLSSFTAEDLRMMVARMNTKMLGDGLWIGQALNHEWFDRIGFESASRPEAKGRIVGRYKLSEAGQAERRRLEGVVA
jgi:hypothetical protein